MDYLAFILLGVSCVTLLLAAVIAYKIWRAHLMLYLVRDGQTSARRHVDQIFHQVEALLGIYTELRIERALPGTRGWATSPDFLLELARHALRTKPTTVVECGSGVSTVILARCLQLNGGGHVYSMDHDARFAQKTRDNLAYHGLTGWATVIDAPLRPHSLEGSQWSWYAEENLPAELKIDLLVVDGPPMTIGPLARYPAGPLLFPRLSEHAAVFVDDAMRREESDVVARWKRTYSTAKFDERDCEKGCVVLTKVRASAMQISEQG